MCILNFPIFLFDFLPLRVLILEIKDSRLGLLN